VVREMPNISGKNKNCRSLGDEGNFFGDLSFALDFLSVYGRLWTAKGTFLSPSFPLLISRYRSNYEINIPSVIGYLLAITSSAEDIEISRGWLGADLTVDSVDSAVSLVPFSRCISTLLIKHS
jgi:hypothetical protein